MMFANKGINFERVICCINCVVVIVLIRGFRQEFKGKRTNAKTASKDGGTYMMRESRHKVVTVIETRKLVTITAPKRTITCNRLCCDFFIF